MCSGPEASKSNDAVNYRRLGDFVHRVNVMNTLIFCVCVVYFRDNTSLFDGVWAKDGFCVSNPTTLYWTSHDLCLYADVILASACGVAYWILHKEDGMKPANDMIFHNIFGVVAHGLGHGGIAYNLRSEDMQRLQDDETSFLAAVTDLPWVEILQKLLVNQGAYLLFWIFLLKPTMPLASMNTIVSLSVIVWIIALGVKPFLQFTFVQTVLLIAFSANQLCRPDKERGTLAYCLYGLLVALPLGLVGWLESTMCSSTIIHVGGHVCYDAYVPISMLAFYLICYVYRVPSDKAKPKAA